MTAPQVLQLQVKTLIDTLQREKITRSELADSMFTEGNKGYQQGFADALDWCVHELKRLAA